MTAALRAFSALLFVAVGIAGVAAVAAPADAANSKPVVRDHRSPSPWKFKEKKTNNPTVIRDNRTTPKWQPKTKKPRWPHYPHKH